MKAFKNCRATTELKSITGFPSTELAERRKTWVCPEPKIKSGYLTRYAKLVSSADKGAILQ